MLYIIPTPIWNREDITLRAINLMKQLNIFLCEDTNTTKKLFNLYEISIKWKQFFSITSYSNLWIINKYLDLLENNDIWLFSEAWTPWLSDPWKEMIKYLWLNDLKFEVLPGATALIPCVVSCCFDTSEFVFKWFIPHKKWRQTLFKYIINSDLPVFVYDSVHRIQKNLIEIHKLWFCWKVFIWREISKMFEQKVCADIDNILDMIENKEILLKWEFVLGFYNY